MYAPIPVVSSCKRVSNDAMRFGDKLEKLRAERGLSQEELAIALGTKQQQISRWEKAKNPPKLHYLLLMARCLRADLEYLADAAMEELPAPALTEDEDEVLRFMRTSGLSAKDVIRRVVGTQPTVAPAFPGKVTPTYRRPETPTVGSNIPASDIADAEEIARQARRRKPG